MTIEEQCAAALKRLERSLAISVGMHKAMVRTGFEQARVRLATPYRYTVADSGLIGGYVTLYCDGKPIATFRNLEWETLDAA